jgi:signal peptidase I
MFNKWKKYSYADQKTYALRFRILVLKIVLVISGYIILTTAFFPMIVMESASMSPSIQAGDRFVFFAFGARNLAEDFRVFEGLPFKRGDIVTVNLAEGETGFLHTAVDKLLRFFTAGKAGLRGKQNRVFMKRVIGLPGDEISMVNFVLQVRPAGGSYTYTEYELSEKRHYEIDIPQLPAIWNESIPFSGNMPKRTLGENDCFVLSDDRANTNDSRTWGPVHTRALTGKALFRYWPLSRAGTP